MDLSPIFHPQTLIISFFALILILFKISNDIKEVRSVQRIRRLTTAFVSTHNTPHITVLIDLNRSAEAIYPLIDHLYGQDYKNLEVIIIIKHTAGKYAQTKLAAYRRTNKLKQLKLAKHTKGMTNDTFIRNKATGELIMTLSIHDRLSPNFFKNVALEALDSTATVIAPRQHIAIDTSFASAQQASTGIWASILSRLNTQHHISAHMHSGHVYRRSALINHSMQHIDHHVTIPTVQAAIITSGRNTIQKTGKRPLAHAYLIIILVVLMYLSNSTSTLIIQMILLSTIIAFGMAVFKIKEYSIIQKATLILFTPFCVFITIAAHLNRSSRRLLATLAATKLVRRHAHLLTK